MSACFVAVRFQPRRGLSRPSFVSLLVKLLKARCIAAYMFRILVDMLGVICMHHSVYRAHFVKISVWHNDAGV